MGLREELDEDELSVGAEAATENTNYRLVKENLFIKFKYQNCLIVKFIT